MEEEGCAFCNSSETVLENDLAYSVFDRFPVSEGHMLIIPKRHVESFFDTTREERDALGQLVERCRDLLMERYRPDGFNLGVNDGEAAGQTVMHLHIHLIPRYRGDIDDPRGGIRGAIPGKRKYKT